MPETEAILLSRFAKGGDAEAFAEITQRYAGLVYGAALRILADVDRASDVAQETFLQLTKDAGTVTGSLPGWLHRVATHKAIDERRREISQRYREVRYAAEQTRQASEWKEISPFVDEGLNELDPEIRDVLILHFLQGQTTRQIAGGQSISQATVSRRIEAGVAQLRATLRRRGIIVAVGALSALLGENALKAAPPLLLSELGKMALVGGSAAFSAGGTAAPALNTVVGGILTGVKTNAVAVAAIAIIGVGSVVTYREATRFSSPRPAAAPAESPSSRRPRRAVSSSAAPESVPVSATGRSQAAEQWDAIMKAAMSQAGGRAGATSAVPSDVQAHDASAGTRPGDMPVEEAGGMGGVAAVVATDSQDESSGAQASAGVGFFAASSGDGRWAVGVAPDVSEPPDPNNQADPNGGGP